MHTHSLGCDHDSIADDAALLEALTGPTLPTKAAFARRDAALDPLLIAAAAASGPHVTRNHYHHDFFPGVMLPQCEGSWDWSNWAPEDPASTRPERRRFTYVSRQAPRRQRLQTSPSEDGKENDLPPELDPLRPTENIPLPNSKRHPSLSTTSPPSTGGTLWAKPTLPTDATSKPTVSALEIQCMARTRIPTPHGPVFLHLYHNNHDSKEHLAIVVDPAQFDDVSVAPSIRSSSLDAVWSDTESAADRIIRGAYIGRLSPSSQHPSEPHGASSHPSSPSLQIPPPLIRIHSECFTGETVGSMRCDCGEQLDEAIRQISQPVVIPTTPPTTIPGRGAVIYLRQEGRGIGLLAKIRAYNLQDLGHDTVTANLLLGHQADERGYEVAGAILRDLGLGMGTNARLGEAVRVLTNNPDKVEALKKEGLNVVERVPMIPRSWQLRQAQKPSSGDELVAPLTRMDVNKKSIVEGEDLDKYLQTKVMRMGHILPLWLENSGSIY